MIKTIYKALGQDNLNVALRSGAGHDVRIMERPGAWMSRSDLLSLSKDLKGIAGKTLDGESLTYGVFSGDRKHMSNVIITLVYDGMGQPIAFNALAVMRLRDAPHPIDVLHLGLVMVDPDERSKNLSWVLYGLTCFLILVRRQFRPIWVSNVTQVPAVVGMVSNMFSSVWPVPGQGRRTLNHLLIARGIMASHRAVFGVGEDAGFDEERFVITNAYTGGSDALRKTWEQVPKHRDAQFNKFCAETLDYACGDDLLQLGQMDLTAMRHYLSREVPRSAVFGLILAGSLVALRRLILPALHWADNRSQWSILRPSDPPK